jgi:hypothetical protein
MSNAWCNVGLLARLHELDSGSIAACAVIDTLADRESTKIAEGRLREATAF